MTGTAVAGAAAALAPLLPGVRRVELDMQVHLGDLDLNLRIEDRLLLDPASALAGAVRRPLRALCLGRLLLRGHPRLPSSPFHPPLPDAPRRLTGRSAKTRRRHVVAELGWVANALIGLGGVLYTFGAVIYAGRRPDPAPAIVGYHEVFHALTIAGAALHYAVIAFWVLPLAQ